MYVVGQKEDPYVYLKTQHLHNTTVKKCIRSNNQTITSCIPTKKNHVATEQKNLAEITQKHTGYSH